MAQETFGFHNKGHSENTGPSKLEESLNIVFNPLKELASLKSQGEKFHEIFIGNSSVLGIYRGTTEDGAQVIMPTTFPNGNSYYDKDSPQDSKLIWRNRPSFFYSPIIGFRPIDKDTLRANASGFDEVAHLGDYIGKDNQMKLFEDS